jgi:hypothetical protein
MHNAARFAREKISKIGPIRSAYRKKLITNMQKKLATWTNGGNIGSVRLPSLVGRHISSSCLLVLMFLLTPLYAYNPTADLTAYYEESSDTTICDATTFGIQSAGYPVACKIGTLHIERPSNDHEMYGLRLQRSGKWNNGNEYTLISTETINWQKQFGAQVVAKITRGSQPAVVQPINWSSGKDEFVSPTTLLGISDLPVHVDFYLGIRNIQNARQAEGVGFQFQGVGGHNVGDFQVISRRRVPKNQWEYIYYDEVVPIGSITNPVPFYSVNYNKDSSYFINGVGSDRRIYANLSIEETFPSGRFDLLQLVDASRLAIATARFTLSGYESTNSYGVSLVFNDLRGSNFPSFAMKHEDTEAYIPFDLYLGTETVVKGVPVVWNNLSYGSSNLKELSVGGISLSDAQNKVSGLYSDTISVHITPLDTNIVVQ